MSRTQNTKAVADIIQEAVGGDSVALDLETPYPEDYLGKDGIYLAIDGERKNEVRAEVHDWLKRIEVF